MPPFIVVAPPTLVRQKLLALIEAGDALAQRAKNRYTAAPPDPAEGLSSLHDLAALFERSMKAIQPMVYSRPGGLIGEDYGPQVR